MINDRSQFCFRLKQARLEAKLKQEVVAKYLQIPTSAVSSFESGHRKLDAIELFMLSKIYKKPMEWFLLIESISVFRFVQVTLKHWIRFPTFPITK